MRLQSSLSMILLAVAASLSFGAYAASGTDKPQKGATQADKPVTTTMQPHSHMQEKTGVQPQEQSGEAKAAISKADKDKSKHFHPRDGK